MSADTLNIQPGPHGPLDAYLRGKYIEDTAFAARLQEVLAEVAPLFAAHTIDLPINAGDSRTYPSWLYAVSARTDGKQRELVQLSPSTHCMILFALDSLLARQSECHSLLLGRTYRPPRLRDSDVLALKTVSDSAKPVLRDLLARHTSSKPLVQSSTYGENDPFTLTWMAEIIFRLPMPPKKDGDALRKQRDKLADVIRESLKRDDVLATAEAELHFREVKSCFLSLRRMHLAKTMETLGKALDNRDYEEIGSTWLARNTATLWMEFESELHRHLSYAAMRDARFDPSELAFALEGALHLHPTWVSPTTVDRAFDGLRLSPERQPYWRPITPLLANDRGHVLFLVSIEVANSILRSCEILDAHDPGHRRFSQIEPQLRSYAFWLLDEIEEVTDENGQTAVGWRSDYEDKSDRDTIFLWYTSHVVIFLNHYRSLLRGKIGSDAVQAAGLLVKRKTRPSATYWDDEPLRSINGSSRYQVGTIEEQYLERREANTRERPAQSLLLYGPPGTGKTMLAEQLAARLRRPLIVITVSDFLAAGAAEIENRAKNVFEVLRAQDDVVVLFDEIDQFLLDRNSQRYREQDDVFKFMTPGMLTKLQDLRQAKDCVFVIATNYYERIDAAIKRPGRLDRHFLLSLPDLQQRAHLLARLVIARFPDDAGYDETGLREAIASSELVRRTALYGFGDLENLVQLRAKIEPTMNPATVVEALESVLADTAPSTSLISYETRFSGNDSRPFEEFFLSVYLLGEAGQAPSPRDVALLSQVLAGLPDGGGVWEKLGQKGVIEDAQFLEALKRHAGEFIEAGEAARHELVPEGRSGAE